MSTPHLEPSNGASDPSLEHQFENLLLTARSTPHFNAFTLQFVQWMHCTTPVVECFLPRISEGHQRFYIVFGSESRDAVDHTIRGFNCVTAASVLLKVVRQVVVNEICRQAALLYGIWNGLCEATSF